MSSPGGAGPATGAPARLEADLFLLHAPSVFDFRDRDDVLFAYLSDSDSVNVTSIYEMFPLGFFALKQHLAAQGLETKIVNVASLMLMHPGLDVDGLLARLEAPVFGFDIHWMVQCHGAIELAARLKAVRPDAVTIFGGISATKYADELIRHAPVDVVVQGFDTLVPVAALVAAVKRGEPLDGIPNLVYKRGGAIEATGFDHKPRRNYNDATVDWSYYRGVKNQIAAGKMIMTLPNTGCAHDCGWCGGSRYAYRNIMGVQRTLITKDSRRTLEELRTMSTAARETSIYALQCYSETKARMHEFLDGVEDNGYRQVFFEQFHLTPPETLARMGQATRAYILLSPESHDPEISRLSGRGTYTMPEMEAWIPRALDAGVAGVMIWFFIGMPRQTPRSVEETVEYCGHLLRKFRGQNVLPLICPMVPFLDPGSRFFEEPEQHGYRIFHRTLDEHRRAMLEPLWHRRLNYETEWMSRRELQDVSYRAIDRLVALKGEAGVLPASICRTISTAIGETQALLAEIERALELDGALPADLRATIRAYNRRILSHSSDQITPMARPFGGRWFDDFTVPAQMIAELTPAPRGP